jgi:peroxiredoxin
MMDQKLEIGDRAPDFNLPGVDGMHLSLSDLKDKEVLVVIFSCNHCPYAQAYEDRIIALQDEFKDQGVGFIAINSNDDKNYPEDSFEKMIKRAKKKGYNFPYLRDESQKIALDYGATHTPHIFVFDKGRKLSYTGKIDDNWREPNKVKEHYLRDAILALVEGKKIENPETYAIGCSIKWAK